MDGGPVNDASEAGDASLVKQRLEKVRATLSRVSAADAAELLERGALLVDIRPVSLREATGGIPGALVIERNVLEWRLDPTSPDRHPAATTTERQVVIFCQEGYASSFAAADLKEMGLADVMDIIGGFSAWEAAGLPVLPPAEAR